MILLALAEGLLIAISMYLGHLTRYGEWSELSRYAVVAPVYTVTLLACMIAMGVYESHIREGMTGMSLRTAVAIFLLGSASMAVLAFVFPVWLDFSRGVLLFATIEAFAMIAVLRFVVFGFADDDLFKRRVVILGTGRRAEKIASRMRRKSDQRAFKILGFLEPHGGGPDLVSQYDATLLDTDQPLPEFCRVNRIEEIVVAMDERRRNVDAAGGLPLEELLDCKLRGIQVCDIQQFIEREAAKVDVDLLRPSWLVFSDGFDTGAARMLIKRAFDLLASALLLFFTWPFMLLTVLAIWLEDGLRAPILYRQTRTGLEGKDFDVIKFRSMSTDAELSGEAIWASRNDPRVTRVGAFIRKVRIDELPQLFNVLKGDMSFVGPRPERPVFVEELCEQIPFYNERHRVKPGITGWAQLCYPYGASVEDAKEKLQYDLYYLKNHSILLDLIILLQTVEVVLVGEGAR